MQLWINCHSFLFFYSSISDGFKQSFIFATALNLLNSAAEVSLHQLQIVANDLSSQIEAFPVPSAQTYSISYDMLDTYALQLVPDDAPSDFFPVTTTPNGNCLFNAVSISLVGNESLSLELRVHTALVLLQLREHILNDDNQMVSDLLREQIVLYSPFAQTDYKLLCANATKE